MIIIVESPTKIKTIRKILKNRKVKIFATLGHIKDLPSKSLAISFPDFTPTYTFLKGKKKLLQQIKEALKTDPEIYIATDPDREGEAIAYFLAQELKLLDKKIRVKFHAITKSAIEKALKSPEKINLNLFKAQQTRRILDRLIGYLISPKLFRLKLTKNLSAGRVQTATLALLLKKLLSQYKFKSQTLFKLSTNLDDVEFTSTFKSEKKPRFILPAKVKIDFEEKEITIQPNSPFDTADLQKEAAKLFKFSPSQTMQLAQSLYESGLITYHRTSSKFLSKEAKSMAKNYLKENYQNRNWDEEGNHEAIRPTTLFAKISDKNKLKLFLLIRSRFLASLCKPIKGISQTAKFEILDKDNNKHIFKATGFILTDKGFLDFEQPSITQKKDISFLKNKEFTIEEIKVKKSSTKPPANYTYSSLVNEMKKTNIGRPSTYASTIKLLESRNYIKTTGKNKTISFTPKGVLFALFLILSFKKLFHIKFTAKMEETLDKIEQALIKETKNYLAEIFKLSTENNINTEIFKCPNCFLPLKINYIDDNNIKFSCISCGLKKEITEKNLTEIFDIVDTNIEKIIN